MNIIATIYSAILTKSANASGNRASCSERVKRTASRVRATYVGTDRPLLDTFCTRGSPFSFRSLPKYSVNTSGLPLSAKYKRKLSAPTADDIQFDSSHSTCAFVGRNCSDCVRSSSICRLSACTQNFHLQVQLLIFAKKRREKRTKQRQKAWREGERAGRKRKSVRLVMREDRWVSMIRGIFVLPWLRCILIWSIHRCRETMLVSERVMFRHGFAKIPSKSRWCAIRCRWVQACWFIVFFMVCANANGVYCTNDRWSLASYASACIICISIKHPLLHSLWNSWNVVTVLRPVGIAFIPGQTGLASVFAHRRAQCLSRFLCLLCAPYHPSFQLLQFHLFHNVPFQKIRIIE